MVGDNRWGGGGHCNYCAMVMVVGVVDRRRSKYVSQCFVQYSMTVLYHDVVQVPVNVVFWIDLNELS